MVTLKAAALLSLVMQIPSYTTGSLEIKSHSATPYIYAQRAIAILPPSLVIAKDQVRTDLNDPLPSKDQYSVDPPDTFNQPQYSYESWDVLRQYPRTAPLAEPRTQAAKPPENSNPSKDSKDAQGKTATE